MWTINRNLKHVIKDKIIRYYIVTNFAKFHKGYLSQNKKISAKFIEIKKKSHLLCCASCGHRRLL